MKKAVVIVAGGQGMRMGQSVPKQFIPLKGKPLLMYTLENLHQADPSLDLVLVLPEEHLEFWNRSCSEHHFSVPHRTVKGGEIRFQSVSNGLKALHAGTELVAIHDGVRPFISKKLLKRVFDAAAQYGNAIPAYPITESLRKVDSNGSRPVNREEYYTMQTPQCFRTEMLVKGYGQTYRDTFTDDASVVELTGEKIYLVDGEKWNIKITVPEDLVIATALLEAAYNSTPDGKTPSAV